MNKSVDAPWIKRSVGNQLFTIISLFILLGIFLPLYMSYTFANNQLYQEEKQSTQTLALALSDSAYVWMLIDDFSGLQEIINHQKGNAGNSFILFASHDGKVIAHSDPQYLGKYIKDLPSSGNRFYRGTDTLIDYATPLVSDGKVLGWLRMGRDFSFAKSELVDRYQKFTVYNVIISIVALMILHRLISSVMTKLRQMRAVAEKINTGDLSVRAIIQGEDEASVLARSINSMLDSLISNRDALARERQRLQDIIYGTHAATWEWNVQTGETIFNQRWAEIIGYSLEELEPISIDTWIKYTHPEDLERSAELLKRHFSGESPLYECEARMKHKNGQWIWVLDRGRVNTWTENGEPEWMSGTHLDITELKQAADVANQANIAKSQFLATVSHEIRTPLNVIIGLIYLLKQASLEGDAIKQLEHIDVASNSLLSIINDVLDFSKIEAGELKLEQHPFALVDLVDELLALFENAAEEAEIDLVIEQPQTDIPPTLIGDSLRLKQILVNLIGNALKFTDKAGKVSVSMSSTVIDDNRLKLTIAVTDTGIGISDDAQKTLFDAFTQADSSTTRQYGGTGLGLSIVKRLVNLMGGEITVESAIGIGSTFSFDINLGYSNETISDLTFSVKHNIDHDFFWLKDIKILVVDDSEINLIVAKSILEKEGANVTVCRSGKEAIAFLKLEQNSVDAILMDVQMPEMDGLATTKIIRQQLVLTLPIIAFSAGTSHSEKNAVLDAGMDAFLSKPVPPEMVIHTLRKLISQKRGKDIPRIPKVLPPLESGIPQDEKIAEEWPIIQGIDITIVKKMVGEDVRLFVEILQTFTHDQSNTIKKLKKLIKQNPPDFDQIITLVHKLKGQAGLIGATALFDSASRLTRLARNHDDELVETLSEVEIEMNKVYQQVEAFFKKRHLSS